MAKRRQPKIGDHVTCLYAQEAYYSDYGPNKGIKIEFAPGMTGVVKSIAPKVRYTKARTDPRIDNKDEFLVVDYVDENGNTQRVGLNFCNAALVDDAR